MRKELKTAIELHRSGQLDRAAELYRSVLATESEDAEALHWFGLLHHQAGDDARAVEMIGRAVALRPGEYLYHGNLAEALRAAGDFERAAASCRAALGLWPDCLEALCCLGDVLAGLEAARGGDRGAAARRRLADGFRRRHQ
jgi:Flp pilus assembly protein TadD